MDNTPTPIVVFGSALTHENPRDIDVIYGGGGWPSKIPVWNDEMREVVQDWARTKGLPETLPIDPRRQIGNITIPAMCGIAPLFKVLQGIKREDVEIDDVWNIGSILRVYGGDFNAAWEQLQRLASPTGPGGFNGISTNMDPENHNPTRGWDFDNYTSGVLSLKAGINKAACWPRIRHEMGLYGAILQRIADDRVTKKCVAFFEQHSTRSRVNIYREEGAGFYVGVEYDLEKSTPAPHRVLESRLRELFEL